MCFRYSDDYIEAAEVKWCIDELMLALSLREHFLRTCERNSNYFKTPKHKFYKNYKAINVYGYS